jgi:hypothetical protein
LVGVTEDLLLGNPQQFEEVVKRVEMRYIRNHNKMNCLPLSARKKQLYMMTLATATPVVF